MEADAAPGLAMPDDSDEVCDLDMGIFLTVAGGSELLFGASTESALLQLLLILLCLAVKFERKNKYIL